MTNQYTINGNDAFDTYGLVFQEGTLNELMRLPERKAGVEHDWPDEDGTQRDLTDLKYASRQLSLKCLLVGDSKADFLQKYDALKTFFVGAGYFDLISLRFSKRWKLLYNSMADYKQESENAATFTLELIDDYPNTNFPVA